MFLNKKCFKKGFKRISGRNSSGKITIRHRGGGFKRKVFFIDYFHSFKDQAFTVCGFISKPSFSTSYMVLKGEFNQYHLVINTKGLLFGNNVFNYCYKNFSNSNFKIGSSYYLGDLPVGSSIHNLEIQPHIGGKLIRSSGCYGMVLQKGLNSLVKLPSGQTSFFSNLCKASFGEVSPFKKEIKVYKAGHSRWFGKRPTVRGVAINPSDHPHGGGEGKSSLGRAPVSPWGSIVKGKKK